MLQIWIADTEPLKDPALFERWLTLMPDERKDKISRIAAPEGRRRSLAAGALLQTALAPFGLREGTIRLGQWGKPYLEGREDLFFNLSHSGSRVMLALSDREVGCDVERIRESEAASRVARHYFRPEEIETIGEGKGEEERRERFFRLWVLKESFLKATGRGLSLPLDSFYIRLPGQKGGWITVEQNCDERDFSFQEWSFDDGYRYAVCIAGCEHEAAVPVWTDPAEMLSAHEK